MTLETEKDQRIPPSKAIRGTQRLSNGLKKSGFDLTGVTYDINNLPPSSIFEIEDEHEEVPGWERIHTFRETFAFGLPEKNRPYIIDGFNIDELIQDSHTEILPRNYISNDSVDMKIGGQPINMFLYVSPKDRDPYKLTMVLNASISTNQFLIGELPGFFTSIGFNYDLSDSKIRDYMSNFAERRLPVEIYQKRNRSMFTGPETKDGIEATIRINFQDPNPDDYLKCYEVEITSANGEIFSPNTPDVVTEAFWQENEKHYCMTDRFGTYPFIPPDKIEDISKFKMVIKYYGNSPNVMSELLHDVPLSIDGTNQWHAGTPFGNGKLEIMFKPQWGEENTALVYTQDSAKRITPNQMYKAAEGMLAVKGNLVERLAV